MVHIVEFTETYWEDAAALVAASVRRLRQEVGILPQQYEDGAAILRQLAELAARGPGVAAVEAGRLVGFLCAMSLSSFKGKRGAFSPAWANAVQADDAPRIYQELYAALAPQWLTGGCVVHAVQLLAHDRGGLDGLFRLGFGLNNVDAIRDLAPVPQPHGAPPGVMFRRASVEDVAAVAVLGEGLQRHLADSPIYLPFLHRDTPADYLAWLAEPSHRQWLAFRDGRPIAELRCEPANDTALAMAADAGTTFVTSAYTVPAARRSGVAAALLDCLLADVRAEGFVRCATDFESANLPGARFWLRHFQPTAYAVVRYVDEHMSFAHAARAEKTFW